MSQGGCKLKKNNSLSWASRTAAVALAAATLTMVNPGGAQAGTSCSAVFGCSRSHNTSGVYATAFHNWTCSTGSTGTASTGCAGGDTYGLSNGAYTPSGQDWDVIRVDAGWCYKIHFVNWYTKYWDVTYDRRGYSTPVYVKIEDGSLATVVGQGSGSCP
jgi:hypothetical protein